MPKSIMLFMFVAIYHSAIAGNDTNEENEPLCERAITPFINESDVLNEVRHWLNCGYDYWKGGNTFYGVSGFKEMFGEEGHIWNTSSVIETDSSRIVGYYPLLSNNVVSQNLITFASPPDEIYIHNFSQYDVFYSFRIGIVFNPLSIRQFPAKVTYIRTFSRRIYFPDGSSIVQYEWSNSTQSKFGHLIQQMFSTTEAMAGMIGAFDDEPDFDVGSTIVYIFLCILIVSILTVMLIVCTCVGCTAKKVNQYRGDVANTADAIDMMDFEGSLESIDSHPARHSVQETIL